MKFSPFAFLERDGDPLILWMILSLITNDL